MGRVARYLFGQHCDLRLSINTTAKFLSMRCLLYYWQETFFAGVRISSLSGTWILDSSRWHVFLFILFTFESMRRRRKIGRGVHCLLACQRHDVPRQCVWESWSNPGTCAISLLRVESRFASRFASCSKYFTATKFHVSRRLVLSMDDWSWLPSTFQKIWYVPFTSENHRTS